MDSLFRLCLGYVYQLIGLVKRWSSYFGLPLDGRNFEDTFYQLLHDKNYDEALKLAQKYKYLDIDLVYKCKWRNSSITIQLIDNVLGVIQDKLWAINESVQTVPISYDACRRLLDFGLDEANLRLLYKLGTEQSVGNLDKHSGKQVNKSSRLVHGKDKLPLLEDSDVQDDEFIGLIDFEHLNEQQKELCRCRQNLIRYSHSLEAYQNILGDDRSIQREFDHVFYDEFRRKPPLASCIEFANSGDTRAVETCLRYYTAELSPHLLAILSNFPETLSPYQYRDLLPCTPGKNEKFFQWSSRDGQPRQLSHNSDWSGRDKSASIRDYLKDKNETFAKEFYDKNEHLKKFYKPLSRDLLTDWFIERALEMEKRTLLLYCPSQLLELGETTGIRDLEETHKDLTEFDRIVYDCCTEDNIYLSFGEFNKMSEIQKLILMTGDSVKSCKDRFRFYVIPYLDRRDAKYNLDKKVAILREYFRNLANTREQICRTIYNDLLDRIECDNFVADWTNGMDDAIDEIGEEIKSIERERQAKQISTMASQTFALGDFDECYEACQLIMKKDFKECWPLCCQLGMHQKYTNNEAKYRLLAYALANCDDPDGKISVKILNYIVELRKRDPKIQMAYLKLNM